jgi:hypothetical protein
MVEIKLSERNHDRSQIVSNDMWQSSIGKEKTIIMHSLGGMLEVRGGCPKVGERWWISFLNIKISCPKMLSTTSSMSG